ncbi:MAG: molybdate ABC transporter substrate-binding protein [bacterium]|nr:molybdate ABC transporter substrate-binding protein [bacterium]
MALKEWLSKLSFYVALCLAALPSLAVAGQDVLSVAAASNLTYVMPAIIKKFEGRHKDIKVRLSLASTGNIYSQIKNGAPFDIFLSADRERPDLLFDAGMTRGEPFTYASGGLVLWSDKEISFVEGLFVLSSPMIKKISIANPRHAPYGAAAKNALETAGLWEVLRPKFIYGENVGQAAQFVKSGSVQIGFIAESMLKSPAMQGGSSYILPAGSYDAITQRGVIIKRDKSLAPAMLFRDFLLSDEAKAIFKEFGYGVD